MARQRRRRRTEPADDHLVITVISDDDEDDEEYVPNSSRAAHAGQQHPAQQEVEVVHINDTSPVAGTGTASLLAPPASPAPAPAQPAAVPGAPAAGSPAKQVPKQVSPAKAAAAGGAGASDSEEDDSGSGCIICMELMSEQGGHRPATLKCGHIFGEACIRRWLKEKSRCPQCNKSSRARDITALFNLPKKVAAGRGSASAELEQQLQQAEQKAAQERMRAQQLQMELQRMQAELAMQRRRQTLPPVLVGYPGPPPHQQQQQYPPPPPPRQQQLQFSMLSDSSLINSNGLPNDSWTSSVLRMLNGGQLSDQEVAAVMSHPNTAAYFGSSILQDLSMRTMQLPLAQHQRNVLTAAVNKLRSAKRSLEQSRATDAAGRGGRAGAGVGAGSGSRSSLPPGVAAAAAAEARAGQAVQVLQQQQPAPGSTLCPPGSSSAAGGSGMQRQVVQLALHALEKAANTADSSSTWPQQTQQVQQPQQQQSWPQQQQQQCWPAQQQQQQQHVQQQAVRMPGSFELLQEYELAGSRAFDLDVEGALLVVAEGPLGGPSSRSRLRRVSMLAPGSPAYVMLPAGTGAVRCLARQPLAAGSSSGSGLMAVATDKAGLIIAKPSTNNIIATIPTQAPVWSVAWSRSNQQQLLLGLDKGRLAMVDLRMTGSRALLLVTGTPSSSSSSSWPPSAAPTTAAAAAAMAGAAGGAPPSQPWHSLVMLEEGWGQSMGYLEQQEERVMPEALMACPAGVYCWSLAQPNSFQLLLPSSWHGGQCEGLALADKDRVAVSFRRLFGAAGSSSNVEPAHWLARLAPAPAEDQEGTAGGAAAPAAPAVAVTGGLPAGVAVPTAASGWPAQQNSITCAVAAGRQQLLSSTLRLTGHTSSHQITHGCFMPPLPDLPNEQLLFASADEATCEPRLWGCSSGAPLVQQQPWRAMSSPVLQLAGGSAPAFSTTLLGVMSERQLKIYHYAS